MVGGVAAAAVPLGRHVQTDWLGDRFRKPRRQVNGGDLFVVIVESLESTVLTELVQQVTDVVQQTGGYYCGTGSRLFSLKRTL